MSKFPVIRQIIRQISAAKFICIHANFPVMGERRTAAGILLKDEKVLLGLRMGKRVYSGCWDLFGGGIEEGETVEETLMREVREELGVDITKYEFFRQVKDTHPETGEPYMHNIFIVRDWVGHPKNTSPEHSEIAWYGMERVQGLRMVDWVREAVSEALRRK